jgi:hypothetical protein
MTTLIGTPTNLLVAGLMGASDYEGLGLFDLFWVGGPRAGGFLSIKARKGFDNRWNQNREEFYLVAPCETREAPARKGPPCIVYPGGGQRRGGLGF